ncbi:MAG: glycosyltransferase [Candidatus Aenigmatarchaeota archaeon]
MNDKIFSIIIPTYNENIKTIKLLDSLKININNLKKFTLEKIYIVASGKTDKLKKYCKESALPIKLLIEKRRHGKAHAINLGLRELKEEYIILMSGDIILADDTIKKLLEKINDENIGAVTGRPIPNTQNENFVDYFVNLIWKLHNIISKEEPKAGEILAFKNVFARIPEDTAADEEFIKAILLDKGYSTSYARNAKIYNEGPKNISDLFEQRRRIFIGHLDLEKRMKYDVPTTNNSIILKSICEYLKREGLEFYLFAAIVFEFLSRIKGFFDYFILKRNPYKWKRVSQI